MAINRLKQIQLHIKQLVQQRDDLAALARTAFSSQLLEQHGAVESKILEYEREYARAVGESYAVEIDIPMPWSLSSRIRIVYEPDGTALLGYDNVLDFDGTAVLRLKQVEKLSVGGPNDEVRIAHELRPGLGNYGGYIVERSEWLRTERELNSLHHGFHKSQWEAYSHFIFAFHDCQVEAICLGFESASQSLSLDEWISIKK